MWFQKSRQLNKVTWLIKKYPPKKTQNQDTLNHHPIFHLFPQFENIVSSVRQVLPLWIQVVSFLQLPHSSLWPAGKHSCGKARQKRGEDHSKNQAKVVSKELSLCSGVHLQNMMGKISEKLVLKEEWYGDANWSGMDMSPVHQVWPKPSCKAQWKGEEELVS